MRDAARSTTGYIVLKAAGDAEVDEASIREQVVARLGTIALPDRIALQAIESFARPHAN